MKEHLVRFGIEGFGNAESFITVEDGKLNTAAAEEQFYALLRKNEKSLLKDAEESEHDSLIENLTPQQEVKLMEAHAEDYHGTDDDMPDDYERYLENLTVAEIKTILYEKDLIDLQKFEQREKEDMQG